jgi:hypothetical protein
MNSIGNDFTSHSPAIFHGDSSCSIIAAVPGDISCVRGHVSFLRFFAEMNYPAAKLRGILLINMGKKRRRYKTAEHLLSSICDHLLNLRMKKHQKGPQVTQMYADEIYIQAFCGSSLFSKLFTHTKQRSTFLLIIFFGQTCVVSCISTILIAALGCPECSNRSEAFNPFSINLMPL